MNRALILLILVLAAVSLALAGKHPVPLDPKTDAAKCLECHEDKTKGANVHSAMAMGCTSCHEVRVNRDITRIKLTTATPTKLCLTCHADKNAAEAKGVVHAPAVRDCAKCHAPHTAPNKNLLLKDTSGGKDENLCLSCHTQGLNVPEKGSRHAALDMGCATCHTTHKVGDPAKKEFKFHLTKSTPGLCIDCHDPKDAAIAKAHGNQPIGTADCVTCHDPHQSKRPKLMQAFVHSPFEGGTASCEACHQPAKNGKVVLTQATSKELCLSCHADQAEQHKKKYLHQPAFDQGCATCHEPHGGENAHLMRAKTPNDLCLECHGPEIKQKKVEGESLVTIFNGKVKLPENYFNRVVRLPIKYGLGHPVDRHPIKDQMDPDDVTKVRVAINCTSCHQPHSSAQPNLLVKDQANGLVFCASCHKNLGGH